MNTKDIIEYLEKCASEMGRSDVLRACKTFLSGKVGQSTPRKRKTLNRALLRKIWLEQDKKCARCGNEMLFDVNATGDHIKAFSKGGSDEEENLVVMERVCNSKKSGKDLFQESKSSNRLLIDILK